MPNTTAVRTAQVGAAPFFAGKNKIINGDFGINQRALTSTTTSGYGFDRWNFLTSNGTVTHSAQTFTPGAAPVSGYEATNYSRIVTSGQTLTSAYTIYRQNIEDVRTLAGQTATISFWAKAASGTPKIAIEFEQSFGTGGSPSAGVTTYAGQATLTTSWARYTATIVVPSISGKTIGTTANTSSLILNLWVSAGSDFNARTGSLGIQTGTFDIWGVQVEAGSTATAFQTATGSIQGELAACQRYYYRTGGDSTVNPITMGIISGSTTAQAYISVPVTMRIPPTSVEFSTLKVSGGSMGATAVSAITLNQVGKTTIDLTVTCAGASFTNGAACVVQGNGSTSNYLGLSAEL